MERKRINCIYSALLLLLMAACGTKPVDPDTPFVIEGELENYGKAEYIQLIEWQDGEGGHGIAIDTLKNGKFRFEAKVNEFSDYMSLLVFSRSNKSIYVDGYSAYQRTIYVEPGAHIKVKGKNTHVSSWEVKSKVKLQKEYDAISLAGSDLRDKEEEMGIRVHTLVIEDRFYSGTHK